MILHIHQKPERLTFLLKKRNKTIKKETYGQKKEISQEFLEFLDKFLKKIKIEITSIESFKLRQSKDVGFTARRVVKAIVNILNFVLASITP